MYSSSQKTYYSTQIKEYKKDSKKTWQILNGILHRTSHRHFPSEFDINGSKSTNQQDIANHFNQYFTESVLNLHQISNQG